MVSEDFYEKLKLIDQENQLYFHFGITLDKYFFTDKQAFDVNLHQVNTEKYSNTVVKWLVKLIENKVAILNYV